MLEETRINMDLLKICVLQFYMLLSHVNFICGKTALFLCRWCDYARILSWPWRTVLHTSWTCYLTPTSIFAPSCPATRARWRRWVTTSTSVSSWRTWRRRQSRRSVCSRKAKSACMRRTRSQGEPGCTLFRHHTVLYCTGCTLCRHDGTTPTVLHSCLANALTSLTSVAAPTHFCSLLVKWYLHNARSWVVCKSESSVESLVVHIGSLLNVGNYAFGMQQGNTYFTHELET